jgi:hypothetical protein
VNQNEKVIANGLNKILNFSEHEFQKPEEEIGNVNLLNEQLRLVQREIEECQHSFETFIEAFVHAEQGALQPQLITVQKIKNFVTTQKLLSGTD